MDLGLDQAWTLSLSPLVVPESTAVVAESGAVVDDESCPWVLA